MVGDSETLETRGLGLVDAAVHRLRRPRWWAELCYLVIGYLLYAQVRDLHGRFTTDEQGLADAHGRAIWHAEAVLHLDVERSIQGFFLHHLTVLRLLNGFYGGGHFLVTVIVMVWLLVRRPAAYRFWRTVLAWTTGLALIVFTLYPTAPPRLLPGGTVDTLARFGGLWSYNHGVIERISDPFAAMPSLHLGWACWVAAALWATLPPRWWIRVLVVAYPGLVFVTVMATGVHYVLDTVAGVALLLTVSWVTARLWPRWLAWRTASGWSTPAGRT